MKRILGAFLSVALSVPVLAQGQMTPEMESSVLCW